MVKTEFPSVEKEDIQLYATPDMLTISMDAPERRFYKELEFPVEVDEATAVSKYTNDILETTFHKKKEKGSGRKLAIE